jgi:hypothetical protein
MFFVPEISGVYANIKIRTHSAIRSSVILVAAVLITGALHAQSDNETLNSKYSQLLNRLDIKLQNDSILGFSAVKPYSRHDLTSRLEMLDSLEKAGALHARLSPIDKYHIRNFLMDNSEWTSKYKDSFHVQHPLLKTFYVTPSHFYAVDTKKFTLRVEPLLNLQFGGSNGETKSLYRNSRGILLRGNINKAIGFYTALTDNQERVPDYVQSWVKEHNAVPGVGFYKGFKNNGYDYFDMKGGITFKVAKYINFQLAYDKLFIGDGIRSLYLSDFSNNYLFFRLNTRLWKLKYEMIIAETMQSVPQIEREMKPKNYMAIHHLSTQLTRWLNLGFYENIMEEGTNGLQLSYLNPMIFYRAAESNLGAAGKANIGIDLKANISKKMQLYSQLLINEFVVKEVRHYNRGSYVNKQALQLGAKYIDAFGISNLDLQAETNWIRPFTYTNFDSVTNLTHYNQPLAHPLGANVRDLIVLINYQPAPKLFIKAKLNYFKQGLDSAETNTGSNIFRGYMSRPRDYGFFIGSGIPVKSLTAAFYASYEFFENMFIDLNVTRRSYNIQNQANSAVLFYNLGVRINMSPRTFDF